MNYTKLLSQLETTKSGNYKKHSVEKLLCELSCNKTNIAPKFDIELVIVYDINDDEWTYSTHRSKIVLPEKEAKEVIKQYDIFKKEISKWPYYNMGSRYRAHSAYTSHWDNIFKYEPGELISLQWKYL